MVVWTVSAASAALALSVAFFGVMLDFSPLTFRVFQIGVGLLGPLMLGWGAVEYALASPRIRFGTRLVVTTLTVVPLVILATDRLRGQYGDSYPAMSQHYDLIPATALGLVHTFVVAAFLGCGATVALRARERPRFARHQGTVLGLAGTAAVVEVLVSRVQLGILDQLLLLAAAACLWTAVTLALRPPRERRTRRRGGRRAPADDAETAGGDPDETAEAYDEQEGAVWGKRRRRSAEEDREPQEDHDGPPPPAGGNARMRGIITIYTLAEGRGDTFDDYADELVEEVARREADTLLFTCHTVGNAPSQRITYAIYRDELAVEEHEQQPHVVEFARQTSGCVVATNVIELSLAGGSATENLPGLLMPR
ncbi:quinol monooxygenase YgiN [Haloactinospora alba]|uniref:Quinol monooxygenase YgiN n=2 Tax=Haloactinospora alba TaxID=405555 RepID=A0A543N6Y5_9ACTN|nr:quinol monooxygenase YgiN [Haloactinospora alba]